MLVKKLPRVGQAQRTGPAFEKHHAQLFLELVDLPTERRLGHLQRLRGTRDAPLSDHGHEVAEVAQFHCHTFKVARIPTRCLTYINECARFAAREKANSGMG